MPQVALGSNRFRLICGWLPLKNASIVSRWIFMQQNEAISAITLHLSLETAKNSSLVIQHRLLYIIYLSVTLLQLCLCKINLNKHSCKTKFWSYNLLGNSATASHLHEVLHLQNTGSTLLQTLSVMWAQEGLWPFCSLSVFFPYLNHTDLELKKAPFRIYNLTQCPLVCNKGHIREEHTTPAPPEMHQLLHYRPALQLESQRTPHTNLPLGCLN